jgi:hypothetical protein
MDSGLEQVINVIKERFNLTEKDAEEIKEQVSYLKYSFYDVLKDYPKGKMSMDSLIIFFGYFFGALIENDAQFETFIAIAKAIYTSKKNQKQEL